MTDVEQPEDEQRTPEAEAPAEEPAAEAPAEQAEQPTAEQPAEVPAEQPAAEQPEQAPAAPEAPVAAAEPAAPEAPVEQPAAAAEEAGEEEIEERPRVKPEIPGADLVPDIVPEGGSALAGEDEYADRYATDEGAPAAEGEEEAVATPIADAAISLATGARYTATGKRKTAVARVILKPGTGEYRVNGKALEAFFPRPTLQRTIRQPLETVAYEAKMDVVAKLHGGGVSAQAGALRHGIARALLEADPNLRGELKRRGFLTRDARAKERKKAGLKKARKRPQFSKR